MDIVMVGAGNLATHLACALYEQGYRIRQVYSRTEESASLLANQVEADYTNQVEKLCPQAAIYICALKDDVLPTLIPQLTAVNPNALWLHTAGSIPMDVWEGHVERYGVIYPLQTFSKHRKVDFEQIPIFIEVKHEGDLGTLDYMAHRLTDKVYACNFTNHMYALAQELLDDYGLPFDVMLPLIDETTQKVHRLSPKQAQTGPAARGDKKVMDAHRKMLADKPQLECIYQLLSDSIEKMK